MIEHVIGDRLDVVGYGVVPAAYRRAMFYGSVMGSFACERFGTERLQQLSRKEIDDRFSLFRELTHLD